MLAALGAAGWLGLFHNLGAFTTPQLGWWVFALAFFATERWVVLANPRRGAPAISVSAAPFAVGLFYAAPADLLVGYLVGAAAAAVTRRPLVVALTAFSLARFTFFAALGEGVFRAMPTTAAALDWRGWLAATLAILVVASRRLLVAPTVVIQRTNAALPDAVRRLRLAGMSTATAGCVGLVAVVLIHVQPDALVLLGPVGVAMFAALRAYVRERHQRQIAEFLYGAGDALGSRELESAIVDLLSRARTVFDAEMAQLTIFPALRGEKAFRTTVRAGQADNVMEAIDLSDLDDVLDAETDGVIIERTTSPLATVHMLERRGVDEGMVALLRGQARILGSLMVGGHVDARHFDSRDLQLFQTLASQTATTLENGRLERSIARLTELQEQLAHQAFHDSLTDLANRALFTDRIEHALQRSTRSGRAVAVLFIDLDDFKTVNDSLGHSAGDELLIRVAARLRQTLRAPDTAARLGGDEFAVLLEDLESPSDAEPAARRTFDALRTPFDISDHVVNVRVSIGVAVADKSGDNASSMMRRADVAMYTAKGSGKDRYVVFAPGMESDVVGRNRLRGDLERALAEEQFVLHYQPIIDLRTGEVTGLEALIRWRHPSRGLIAPGEFIPLAEQSGLILPLGEWVLRSACAAGLRLQTRYPTALPRMVSVNISARQLHEPLFVEGVLDTVNASGLNPAALVLELTESILLQDAASGIVKLQALQRAGIRIAVDDFGTGYSSLSYLRHLPVDILKIAKPFVDDLAAPVPNGDFARAIVSIASALQLNLVAEGIEAGRQVVRLRELGCTQGQGYHLFYPAAPDEIESLLRRGGIDPWRLGELEPLQEQLMPVAVSQ